MNPAQLHSALQRLRPHVDASRLALAGGIAIGLHLPAARGHRPPGAEPEDIDFVATAPDAVFPTVTTEFLVSHFHLPRPAYPKFLIQLVDPTTRVRVDVFPDTLNAVSRARDVDLAGGTVLVLQPSDMLDHKLAMLASASRSRQVDAKHYEHARELGVLCLRDVPAIAAAHLTTPSYSRNVNEQCVPCAESRCVEFPLADKRVILDILGYV